ncbi:hypothetical protein LMG27952_07641 [Paraburkholderia hiiakae]|uniref:CENP-V/GFA domain-containing protein n=1 Tax=Paraburkholderia hiiakae TaxID=1081782 RepID=A0ABN7IHW7_9BURK|nr:GFA family protein [Paraburkholderia hiiakae]CAD6561969.1 hypothetical protein LMG27952_07641 [Paraburkholderia hiiakae]
MSADTAPTHTNAPATLHGQCLCGAVRYAVANAFRYAFNCHCSQCRRATGSAFKPFAGIESEALRLIEGEEQTLVYGNPQAAHDVHCGRCGSLLYSVVREGAYVHVTLGTLTDTPDIRAAGHMFVRSKAPWFEITDSLPQYDEFPP